MKPLLLAAALLAAVASTATGGASTATTPPLDAEGACLGIDKSCPDPAPATPLPGARLLTGTASTPVLACPSATTCPDLQADGVRLLQNLKLSTETFASTDCNLEEGSVQAAGTRELVRFTFKAVNVGNANLHLGDPAQEEDLYEWGTCHGHWHFQSFADYRLWTLPGYLAWQNAREDHPDWTADQVLEERPRLLQALRAGHKQGFCLTDVERQYILLPLTPVNYPYCSDQGISVGWADVYGSSLDGQFIDVTGLPAGLYVLEAEANPDRIVEEPDYSNNAAAVLVPIT